MQLGDALSDLRDIAKLPGTILLPRGNHDFWWSSLSQLRACLPENMHAVQNDAFDAGVRVLRHAGMDDPAGAERDGQDEKALSARGREGLENVPQRRGAHGGRTADLCNDALSAAAAGDAASGDGVHASAERIRRKARCVYGHLHGQSVQRGFSGNYRGVRYDLVSCDALGFALKDVSLERGRLKRRTNEKQRTFFSNYGGKRPFCLLKRFNGFTFLS